MRGSASTMPATSMRARPAMRIGMSVSLLLLWLSPRGVMHKKDIKIRSSEGAQFDCYVVAPETGKKVPAIVLASAIHGVDPDLRAIADEFAARGYIAAAPDLFWRTVPGPLGRDDPRTTPRGQPRLEKIRTGERGRAGGRGGVVRGAVGRG